MAWRMNLTVHVKTPVSSFFNTKMFFFLVTKNNKLQVFILNLVQEESALFCEHVLLQ